MRRRQARSLFAHPINNPPAQGADHRLHPLPWALPVPLRVYGHYSRAEIESAFGVLSTETPWIDREGVLWHQPSATDLLFVTLCKSEALFSPTTRYNDYAISPWEFHWESQSLMRGDAAVSVSGVRGLREPRSGADLVCPRVAIPAAWLPVMALAV